MNSKKINFMNFYYIKKLLSCFVKFGLVAENDVYLNICIRFKSSFSGKV